MALDPSIPLQVRPIQLDNPQDIQAKGLQLRQLYRQNSQADQDEADRKTLASLYRNNLDPTTGAVNHQGVVQGLAQAGMGDKIPAYVKSVADMEGSQATLAHTRATTTETELTTHKKRLDILNGGLSALLANPNVTHDDVIAQINNFVNQGLITPEQGAEAARNTPGRPEQLRPFLIQKAMEAQDASKQIDAVLPKYNEQNRGGTINEGTVDPLTGKRTAGANVAVTPKPGMAGFTDDGSALLASLAAHGVSLPAGMRSKEQQVATVNGLLRKFPNSTPDEIAEAIATGQVDFGAIKKETQTAAAQSGRVAIATNELATMAPLVLGASANVDRTRFVPVNKLLQMGEAAISDPNLRKLRLAINSYMNAYDQLAARGGTDMNKRAEAHSMMSSADSPEALQAAVEFIQQEAAAAGQAASSAQRYHKPGELTQPMAASAAVPSATGPNGEVIYFRNGKWGP